MDCIDCSVLGPPYIDSKAAIDVHKNYTKLNQALLGLLYILYVFPVINCILVIQQVCKVVYSLRSSSFPNSLLLLILYRQIKSNFAINFLIVALSVPAFSAPAKTMFPQWPNFVDIPKFMTSFLLFFNMF